MPTYTETNRLYEEMTEGSRKQIAAAAIDSDGSVVSPATFSGAEYIIADTLGNIQFTATLNNGIAIDGSNFVVTIEDDDINFNGEYLHQFRLIQSGEKLEPLWRRRLTIKPRFAA